MKRNEQIKKEGKKKIMIKSEKLRFDMNSSLRKTL